MSGAGRPPAHLQSHFQSHFQSHLQSTNPIAPRAHLQSTSRRPPIPVQATSNAGLNPTCSPTPAGAPPMVGVGDPTPDHLSVPYHCFALSMKPNSDFPDQRTGREQNCGKLWPTQNCRTTETRGRNQGSKHCSASDSLRNQTLPSMTFLLLLFFFFWGGGGAKH